MNRRGLLIGVGALALAGCATAPPPMPGADSSELEALYGVIAGRDGLTVRVPSNGCTAKSDFAFYVERSGATPAIAFGRRRVDTCRSFAAAQASLDFTWAELGLPANTPFALLNPLTAFPGP